MEDAEAVEAAYLAKVEGASIGHTASAGCFVHPRARRKRQVADSSTCVRRTPRKIATPAK
jgi:hypothetical protein